MVNKVLCDNYGTNTEMSTINSDKNFFLLVVRSPIIFWHDKTLMDNYAVALKLKQISRNLDRGYM